MSRDKILHDSWSISRGVKWCVPGSSLGRHLESGVDPGNEVENCQNTSCKLMVAVKCMLCQFCVHNTFRVITVLMIKTAVYHLNKLKDYLKLLLLNLC